MSASGFYQRLDFGVALDSFCVGVAALSVCHRRVADRAANWAIGQIVSVDGTRRALEDAIADADDHYVSVIAAGVGGE